MSNGLMCDSEIRDCINIRPFSEHYTKNDVISYGLESYGYSIRPCNAYWIFTNTYNSVIDPKDFDSDAFVEKIDDKYCIIPPNSFALAESMENIEMPDDVLALCVGKSTYARCGIIIPTTCIQPGFKGKLTIEISNTTPLPAKVYTGEGICQLVFISGYLKCERSYDALKGKYQNQDGITVPHILPRSIRKSEQELVSEKWQVQTNKTTT